MHFSILKTDILKFLIRINKFHKSLFGYHNRRNKFCKSESSQKILWWVSLQTTVTQTTSTKNGKLQIIIIYSKYYWYFEKFSPRL